jgi:hypothetical protein
MDIDPLHEDRERTGGRDHRLGGADAERTLRMRLRDQGYERDETGRDCENYPG